MYFKTELTPECQNLLPGTDTRYRPDQRFAPASFYHFYNIHSTLLRLYEEGKIEAAEQEKSRLEQKQREFRKRLEAEGKQWTPQYFKKTEDADSPHGTSWVYNRKYWDQRGKPESKIDLFS